MKYIPLIALLITTPALSETILTPEEFETLSTGKTLYFSKNGTAYGAEHFYKDHTTKWRFTEGLCQKGEWFTDGDLFCFNYEGGLETQCWYFFKTDKNGYAARAEDAPLDEILNLEAIDKKTLLCKGDGLAV